MITQNNFDISFINEQTIVEIDDNIVLKNALKILISTFNDKKLIKNSALSDINISNSIVNIDILACDDKKIHEINKEFRQKNKPTDVISFAIFADTPKEFRFIANNYISLGQIIISSQTTLKQANENNKTFEEEFYFLFSHGTLHLLGFDHQTDEKLDFMLKKQDDMIKLL
ncbi:MAG: rRNA maturation RNase YbeY [Candidatus Gastranaerophilales bacterium]|nr:rRNA maturation RNase YbeY [Candidatus Gastranaerophilales bacterium]